MKCNDCGLPIIPWIPKKGNQMEQVAVKLGTLCMLCFEKAQKRFAEMKAYAAELQAAGHSPREIDRIMCEKYDILTWLPPTP